MSLHWAVITLIGAILGNFRSSLFTGFPPLEFNLSLLFLGRETLNLRASGSRVLTTLGNVALGAFIIYHSK